MKNVNIYMEFQFQGFFFLEEIVRNNEKIENDKQILQPGKDRNQDKIVKNLIKSGETGYRNPAA